MVRLVRHGEPVEHWSDAGLTALGRAQAFLKGASLAAGLVGGGEVRIVSSPRQRARETACCLLAGIEHGVAAVGGGDGSPALVVFPPTEDPGLDNFHVLIGAHELEVTAAFQLYERTRGGGPHAGRVAPGWVVEVDRFWRIHDTGGDPIGHWLRQPVQHLEPAPAVVRRVWQSIVGAVDAAPCCRQFVMATHSGPIRAVVAQAFGTDPGDPAHLAELTVRLAEDRTSALVSYGGEVHEVEVPAGVSPSWFT